MVVAIDGPAGTGKSSVSACVAHVTGFSYLNSGRFYRAIALTALTRGVPPDDESALAEIAAALDIRVDGEHLVIDGHRRADELHSSDVDAIVAAVSAVPAVRARVNERLLALAADRDVVAEGRDMATVVFPDAEVKVYLDADPIERARRRRDQLAAAESLESIAESIRIRDEIDRSKAIGSLRQAPDAHYIDTTHLTLEGVCETVVAIIREHTSDRRSI